MDFAFVFQAQIAQMVDPVLFLVGSRSWSLHSLWDAQQDVKALFTAGFLFLEIPCLGCRLPIWRDSGACVDIYARGMIASVCPASFLSLLWGPWEPCCIPVSCLPSAYSMNLGFSLQVVLCSLFSFLEWLWYGKEHEDVE